MITNLSFLAKLVYKETRAASGVNPARTESFSVQAGGTLDVATYDFVHAGRSTLASSGSATIDLFTALTSYTGNTKTGATLLLGLLFKTSGTAATASCRIEPGASNPCPLPFTASASDTPYYTLNAGDSWFADFSGNDKTISTSAKNVTITNPGTTNCVVDYYFVLGGGANT